MTGWSWDRLSRGNRGLLVSAALIFLAGCGQQPSGEITGVVTLDGQPMPDIEVRFLPDPEKGTTGRHAAARTDVQGRYRLVVDKVGRDTVPVGFHRVCLYDLLADDPYGSGATRVREPAGVPLSEQPLPQRHRSRIPLEYITADSTPLRNIEVKAGSQTINLEIRPKR
jgi:hypothetical protein